MSKQETRKYRDIAFIQGTDKLIKVYQEGNKTILVELNKPELIKIEVKNLELIEILGDYSKEIIENYVLDKYELNYIVLKKEFIGSLKDYNKVDLYINIMIPEINYSIKSMIFRSLEEKDIILEKLNLKFNKMKKIKDL